jgi:hypothetical protein
VYTKHLEQLMRLLQASRRSGILTIEDPERDRTGWQGKIRLVEGNVTACYILRKTDGQILQTNDEALRWLMSREKLYWDLEEGDYTTDALLSTPPVEQNMTREGMYDTGTAIGTQPLPAAPAGQNSWIPRRTMKGTATTAQSLGSFEYIQVFTLVNGHNTLEGLARILRKPPHQVMRILETLRDAGLIE